ncbi:hypothetical protein [Panacagrimonas sp.]|jgi:hypothetical protein|uniref:hypothetical protein n=1 Tax=Panacagrimonas sp. TaxID=2480088 RepID=UPI003B52AB75
MNRITRRCSILALVIAAPLAFAHDPAEHAKEAAAKNAAPDCAAMKNMDHSKMDANDPVMKAMMAKCGGADAHAGMDHGKAGSAPAKPDAHGGH